MNKFILEQLQKTKIVLPNYNDKTTQLLIRKSNGNTNSNDLEIGHCYSLYLEDYIIHEPDNFTLSTNWNNGTKPVENKVNAQVRQTMGKMVKIYTQGIESKSIWEGWVPRKAITIIGELNV